MREMAKFASAAKFMTSWTIRAHKNRVEMFRKTKNSFVCHPAQYNEHLHLLLAFLIRQQISFH